MARLKFGFVGFAHFLTIDAFNRNSQGRVSRAHSRIAQKHVARIIVFLMSESGLTIGILTPSENVADAIGESAFVAIEGVFCYVVVQLAILCDIHQSRGGNHGNGTALSVQKHRFATRLIDCIETRKFASGGI